MNDNGGVPHSIHAEEALLGSLLINPDARHDVAFLRGDDFHIVKNGWVYDAMLTIAHEGGGIDYLTVCDELRRRGQLEESGGPAYLTSLVNATPSTLYAETYGRIIERAAIERRLLTASTKIAQAAVNAELDIHEKLAAADSALMAATDIRSYDDADSVARIALDVSERIDAAYLHKRPSGLATGFVDLDPLLGGGLERGRLYIAAGRPGMGKTSLWLSIALHIAQQGKPALLFSLEMSKAELTQRLLAMLSGVSTKQMRAGDMTEQEYGALTAALGTLVKLPIYIDYTPGLTPALLRAKATRLVPKHSIAFVGVDYLQLMEDPTRKRENRTQEVSAISRAHKQLAGALNVPVMAVAQLSRAVEHRQDKRPTMADLRESGQIEQDADVIMFIYRDEEYNENSERLNQADVIIGKHRDGPTGTVSLFFRKELTLFANLKKTGIDLSLFDGPRKPDTPRAPALASTHAAHTEPGR